MEGATDERNAGRKGAKKGSGETGRKASLDSLMSQLQAQGESLKKECCSLLLTLLHNSLLLFCSKKESD